MKRHYLVMIPILMLVAASCGKNGNFSSTPTLTFTSVTPDDVASFDSMQIVCAFTDKEGDIQDSIYYRASNGLTTDFVGYAIPSFPTQKNLQGNIILQLYPGLDFPAPVGGAAADTVYISIFIKDQAGHSSDTVQTTPIIVRGN